MASIFDYIYVNGSKIQFWTADGQSLEVDCGSARVAGRIGQAIRQTLPTWTETFDPIGRQHPEYRGQTRD